MEDLLKPDFGVMILTICNFLLLVYLLKRFAWKGLIGALEQREAKITADVTQAAQDRQAAQALKKELEDQLAKISEQAAEKIQQAVKLGQEQSAEMVAQAQQQAQQLLAQTQEQLKAEKEQALAQVRNDIVQTAVLAAQKVLQAQLDVKAADETVQRVLEEIKTK